MTINVADIPLGFGTYGLSNSGNFTGVQVKQAYDLGFRLFDTAENYGESESVLGSALKGKDALICSKFSPENSGAKAIEESCVRSLRHLQRDVIDIYQMHWPSVGCGIELIAERMLKLIEKQYVRKLGFCNITARQFDSIKAIVPPDYLSCVQLEYSLDMRQSAEDFLAEITPYSIPLLAYSPLSQGAIRSASVFNAVNAIASRHGVSWTTIVLSWLLRRPGTIIPIPKTSSRRRMVDFLKAIELDLPDCDLDEITALSSPRVIELFASEIVVTQFGMQARSAYTSVEEAIENHLGLCPSPLELAEQIRNGLEVGLIKVARINGGYKLMEGRLKYWAWRLAFDDRRPIKAIEVDDA